MRRVSVKAIERGWDDLVRLAASIRAGKGVRGACHPPAGVGSGWRPAAPRCRTPGRLLRTLFLCDYLAIPDYRREIHTLLNRGESVHQLQRAIHGGQVAPERGRRRQEMAAISGAHALLTNIVLAWNTNRMDTVVTKLNRDGVGIGGGLAAAGGPAHFSHINFRGTFRFNVRALRGRAGRGTARLGAARPAGEPAVPSKARMSAMGRSADLQRRQVTGGQRPGAVVASWQKQPLPARAIVNPVPSPSSLRCLFGASHAVGHDEDRCLQGTSASCRS